MNNLKFKKEVLKNKTLFTITGSKGVCSLVRFENTIVLNKVVLHNQSLFSYYSNVEIVGSIYEKDTPFIKGGCWSDGFALDYIENEKEIKTFLTDQYNFFLGNSV